ncbi:MAG: nicotinate-nucleotide adenylyltransferase [Candidatus Marinimicrobia bacterium]|nr:nicotinate-nucleotide adenylyltransferase [Candidatus Neomarinimicrobiota bacterium]
MSVCIFGGTFDPPHLGHLVIAEAIRDRLKIDTILFVPAYLPPHKISHSLSSVDARLRMLELAIKGRKGFEISNIEILRKGISFSIDTIRQLKQERGLRREELFFLMGADSLKEFHTWKDPDQILAESRVLVVKRPTFDIKSVQSNFRDKIELIEAPFLEISSSMIRHNVKERAPIDSMVPKAVADYIHREGLYRSCPRR